MNITTLVMTAFLCCCGQLSFAQPSIKDYVKENTVKITNISPYTDDYSELEAIGTAIGDAKIVMLGEQDHGDAPTFLAKSKIIQYLHEEKGFNVMAFESDFFALNAGWDSLYKTPAAMDSFIRDNIFWLWTDCDACQHLLYDYLPGTYQTENPLHLTGFDNQIFLSYSYDSLSIKLDSVFQSYRLPVTTTPDYSSILLPLVDSITGWLKPFADTNQYNLCHTFFSQAKSELLTQLPESNFWIITLDNLIAANHEFQLWGVDDVKGNEVRDEQMAKNIAWLSRVKYPNEKIIVWAHNTHVGKQNLDTNEPYFGETTMGGFMSRDSALIAQTYVLGFTSYEGSTARVGGRMRSIQHKKKSFESWIDDSYFYGFLDFSNYPGNHDRQFWMKGELHRHQKEAWMTKYDGYFYIRTMYPCIDVR